MFEKIGCGFIVAILPICTLIGALLWPYTLNTWLVYVAWSTAGVLPVYWTGNYTSCRDYLDFNAVLA